MPSRKPEEVSSIKDAIANGNKDLTEVPAPAIAVGEEPEDAED